MSKLSIIEQQGQRVLLTAQLADQYGTDSDHIKKNFNNNKERYTSGKHFVLLQGDDLRAFKSKVQNLDLAQNINKLYLWTEKGALLHAKSLNTDEAWEAYEFLVDSYFKQQQQAFKTPTNLKDALLLSVQLLEQKEALEVTNMELSQELEVAAPKASYYDMILSSDTLVTTKLVAKDYGISSAQKLNQMLKDAGIQYKEGRLWYIKAKYANEGYMKADTSRDGYITNKWTQKGRIFLHDFLTERGYKPNHISDEE